MLLYDAVPLVVRSLQCQRFVAVKGKTLCVEEKRETGEEVNVYSCYNVTYVRTGTNFFHCTGH